MSDFDLEQYLSDGIAELVKNILRASLKNPKAGAFFAQYALAAKRAGKRREALAQRGEHIPSFLIASITQACNLRCAGCYDRANQHREGQAEMSRADWRGIFEQAEAMGVAAILLAGGEPMMRPDVIEEAAMHPNLLFPLFTNGTLIADGMLALLAKHRNLIPILSIEGDERQTDARRGAGIYAGTMRVMAVLQAQGLLFGASVTVTCENLTTVTSDGYVRALRDKGCAAVIFVEYVPVDTPALALTDAGRALLDARVAALRAATDMILISFPGDERESGGCLAAGRGFFHINATGGAEPCPFSPCSDTNLKDVPLREALCAPLFCRLREDGYLQKTHAGGCTLFDQADEVKSLLGEP